MESYTDGTAEQELYARKEKEPIAIQINESPRESEKAPWAGRCLFKLYPKHMVRS